MEYQIFSNKGNIRTNNEDNFIVKLEPYPLIIVADGMGGHQAGEVASKIAVDFLAQYQFNLKKQLKDQLDYAINEANFKIIEAGRKNIDYQGMGTTISLGLIINNKLYIAHVGDSRIYLYRDKLKQLTYDHSLVNELLKQDEITAEEALKHPKKNILTQALGVDLDLKIELQQIPLLKGDLLLFCTDGLSDMIKFTEMEEMFAKYTNLSTLSKKLGKKALKNGGKDNITHIICKIT